MVSLKFGGLEKKLNFTIETVCFKNKRSWKLEDHCRSTLTLQVGVDPKLMGIGPAFAIPPALEKDRSHQAWLVAINAINHPILYSVPHDKPQFGMVFLVGFNVETE
jgi:hypothetical protein